MTTTDQFRKLPEFYDTIDECLQYGNRTNTNPRYNYFKQTHFTCGDEQQFQQYRNEANNDIFRECEFTESEFTCPQLEWEKYQHITADSVANTWKYIFHKFKKGIFIQIRNNEVTVMLPFSKHNFTNEWSHLVEVDSTLFQQVNQIEGRKYNPKYINTDKSKWYANNCLVRYEYPISENDSGISALSDMFKELCKHRAVPDIEFFVNKRDFPILTLNETEAYDYIFGENTPLVSHNYNKYAPILSMCSSDKYADIPIPTWDDWARVSALESKYFTKINTPRYTRPFDIEWKDKIPVAMFRGSSTGSSVSINGNPRLCIAYMGKVYEGKDLILDAGITSWNARPRKDKHSMYLRTFDLPLPPLVPFKSPYEQSGHKYIVHIEGHVVAYRLSLELSMGVTILLVDSEFKLWYSQLLEPWKHYVPVKHDLSDLIDKIKWCLSHDSECERMAHESLAFYNKYLCKEGIMDYMCSLLTNLKARTGIYIYNTISPMDIMNRMQVACLTSIPVRLDTQPNIVSPYTRRSWDSLNWIYEVLNEHSFHSICVEHELNVKMNKNSVIDIYRWNDFWFLCKKTYDSVHETFIGRYCINPLLKYIPNFIYTYGMMEDNLLL